MTTNEDAARAAQYSAIHGNDDDWDRRADLSNQTPAELEKLKLAQPSKKAPRQATP
jgi:hypothetical protein